jgi:capsular polysaccharide biosynthesis protein
MLNRVVFDRGLARTTLILGASLWLCARQFRKSELLRYRYGQTVPSMMWRIFTLLLGRSGQIPGLREQVYVSQPPNAFSRHVYKYAFGDRIRDTWLLFLANTFKIAGLFDLALCTYKLIDRTNFNPSLVAAGIGDMFLVEATWVEETNEYQTSGFMTDPTIFNAPLLMSTWNPRTIGEAVDVLLEASKADPKNHRIAWLLTCALIKAKDWDSALAAIQQILKSTPRLSELNIAEAVAQYGKDRVRGRSVCETNAGRWSGWFKADDVDIVDHVAVQSIQGVTQKELASEVDLTLRCHAIAEGKVLYYERPKAFEKVHSYYIDDAEILPSYGLVVASERHLLSALAHVRPIHWHLYTPSLVALHKDRAMIFRETAAKIDIGEAVYFGHNANYFHWICEDLPRLLLFEMNDQSRDRPVLVDRSISEWQQQLLVRLGIAPERWRCVNFDVPLRLAKLNVPGLLSKELLVHPEAVRMMRERLALDGGMRERRKGKRLYLTRKAGGSRSARLLNETEIWERFRRAGFEAVDTAQLTIDKQIVLFSDAEIVAGPGGAALTNLLFAPKDCAALVLAASAGAGETFSSLTSAIGQDYFVCLGKSYARPHRTWVQTNFDFVLNPNDVDLALEALAKG